MSDSDSSYVSSDNSHKRKRTRRPSTPRKKPQLEEGTSHATHAAELARERLAFLQNHLLNELNEYVRPNTYVYTPLKEGNGEEIRVLVIEKGKGDDPIKCRLVPSALPGSKMDSKTKHYPFTALSYFWGEGEPIHEITLSTYRTPTKRLKTISKTEDIAFRLLKKKKKWCNTGSLHVRSNLYVALKRFRDEKENVTMWIDALCIDQEDGHERTAQVKKMHELYIHASSVRIWLGDGSSPRQPSPKPCFEFLEKLLDLSSLDKLLGDLAKGKHKLVKHAGSIVSLMCNKWFSRRWVVQELALARPEQAEVVYGDERMKWNDFADSIAIFIKCQDRILPILSKKLNEKAVSIPELSVADGWKNLGANALVDFTNNLFRRSENGDIQQRMMTLEMLVSSLLAFESSDPRDTIYAVLSLAKDTHRQGDGTHERELDPRLLPIYKKKCLLDVYTDFIQYCVEKSQSLDILLRHWAHPNPPRREKHFVPDKEEDEGPLPTWIPLIQKSSYGTPSQRVRGRTNGQSFVGTSFRTSHKNYTATLELQPNIVFGETPGNEKGKRKYTGHLWVKGLRIGKIKKLSPRAPQGMIFPETFQMAKFDYKWWEENQEWAEGIERVPDAFWRTLCGDRDEAQGNAPSWYRRACQESLSNLYPNGSLRPDDVISLPKAPEMCKLFLSRVKDVMWERRFARVSLHGRKNTFALLPADTRKRDIICVLFGSSVPVVLREQVSGNEKYFHMVGEAFVCGMMEGEAVSGNEWKYPYEDAECFELR